MRILLMIFMLISAFFVRAQVTGVAGHRAVLKTDLINYAWARGGNVSFEYAFTRGISLEFEFKRDNQSYKPKYSAYYEGPTIPGKKFSTKQTYYSIAIKKYTQTSFNAPKGFFWYFQAGFGTVDINGHMILDSLDILGNETYYAQDFEARNIKLLPIEIGVGKKWIFKNWFVLEVSGGWNATYLFNTFEVQNAIEPIDNRIGPSIVSYTGHRILDDGTIVFPIALPNYAQGFSLELSLGVLLPF